MNNSAESMEIGIRKINYDSERTTRKEDEAFK
jgi:hypothetical protein